MTGLLCLDLGTTSTKAALLDLRGRTLATGDAPHPTTRTADGGTEQDPADWARSARDAIAQVLPATDGIAALCLTGQMQDLILESEQGAVRPAVLYTDLRATTEAAEIRADLAEAGVDWDQLAGNRQDASSCAAMFRRLARVEPDAIPRTRGLTFGPAGHLAHLLGAGLRCDPTTAATTGLLDARTRDWSPDIARAAGINPALLPRLTSGAGEIVGLTDARAEALLGMPVGVPIVLAPGDAGAAALGITGLAPGRDHVSLGTSGWLARVRPATETLPADDASHRLALPGGAVLHISAILAAGAAAAWARETHLGGTSTVEADALLEQRSRTHGRGPTGLLTLPSLGGERFPVRDESLRGAVLGLTASTTPVDLYAGMLEGVALALSHALDESREVLPVVGGGAASAPWRRILADVTGRPVRAVDGSEATLHGAALAGAEALGLEHDLAPLADRSGETTEPDPSAAAAFAALRPAHRALYDAAAAVTRLT